MFTTGLSDLSIFLKDKEDIILTTTTKDFVDMCINWHISLKSIGLSELVVVISLDVESHNKLLKNNIFSILLDLNLTNNTSGDWIENAKKYKPLGPLYIYENYNVNIIHLDTDMVYFKNFIPKLKEEIIGYDTVMCSDRRFDPYNLSRKKDEIITVNHDKKTVSNWGPAEQAKFGDKNGAIFYLTQNNKERMIPFLKLHYDKNVVNKFEIGTQEGSLQTMTNSIIREKLSDIRIKVLDVFEFPNGSLWKIPYLRNKIKDTCYLVHYNFHSHADPKQRLTEKINAMREHNHWFL